MMFLKGKLYMKRHMIANLLSIIEWWVDVSYAVHWDYKGHTGAVMLMGIGAIMSVAQNRR